MRIAIDVGAATTNATVAVAGRAVPVLFDAEPLLPSGVWVHADATLSAGRTPPGEATWYSDPFRLLTTGSIPTPAGPIDPVDATVALLRHVAAQAATTGGGRVTAVTLLIPAGWGPRRHALIRDATTRAGLPTPTLLAAPVAAAIHLANTGTVVPDGGCVLVCDIGAATADITVVGRVGTGWQVLAMQSPPGSAGNDIDRALTAHVAQRAGIPADGSPETLSATEVDALTVRVRHACHALAETDRIAVVLPDPHPPAILTTGDVHQVTAPMREAIVAATAAAITAADITDEHLAAITVIGGAAASVDLADVLRARYTLTPVTPRPADRILPAAALGDTSPQIGDSSAEPNPFAGLGRGWSRVWHVIALAIPIAASWFLLWQTLTDGLDILGPHPTRYEYEKLPFLFNTGAYAMGCLFAVLTLIGAGRVGATALLDYGTSIGDPTGQARRAGRILTGSALAGLALAFLHRQVADTILGAPASTQPYLDNVLLPSVLVAVLTAVTGLIAPRIPALHATRWAEQFRYPLPAVVLATLGTLAMSAYALGGAWLQQYADLWLIQLVCGRGGMLLLGMAIAWTLARRPLPRAGLAVLLGLGGAVIYTWQLQDTMTNVYLASVVAWWLIQTGHIITDAIPDLRPGIAQWWRTITSTPTS